MIPLDKFSEHVTATKCNHIGCFAKGAGVEIAMEPNSSGSVLSPRYVVLCSSHMGPKAQPAVES